MRDIAIHINVYNNNATLCVCIHEQMICSLLCPCVPGVYIFIYLFFFISQTVNQI